MRKNTAGFLGIIIVLAVLAGVFVYPGYLGESSKPWKLGLDLAGGSHLVYQIDLSAVPAGDRDSVLDGVRDVIERRVNLFGVGEPQIFLAKSGKENPELIVELAGIKDVSEAIQQIGETPFLYFAVFEDGGGDAAVRRGSPQAGALPTEIAAACGVPQTSILSITNLTGRYVTGAQISLGQTVQTPQVALTFSSEGGQIFEQLTGANVGKPIAVFLDNEMITCPIVQEKITGGQAVITGRFTFNEAKELVSRFNAGALPAPITLINQQTISASLGADSLKKVIFAGAFGTALVALFMILYYRRFGVVAAMALAIYIVLTLAVFKLIPITMTLAGIAGFVLTIGMAVDANILIFERMREELKRGLSRASAMEEGFKRAWPSIRDSNTSTIISAIILYYLTSSFVQGFALALLIGTLVSMFSAITTTRLFLKVLTKST